MKYKILIVLIFASLTLCDSLRGLQSYGEEQPRDRSERDDRRGKRGSTDRDGPREPYDDSIWRNDKRGDRADAKPDIAPGEGETTSNSPYYGDSSTANTNVEPNAPYYNNTDEQKNKESNERSDSKDGFKWRINLLVCVMIAGVIFFVLWLIGMVHFIRYLTTRPSVRNFFGLDRSLFNATGQQGLIVSHGADCKCGHQGQLNNLNQHAGLQVQQRQVVNIPMTNTTMDTNRITPQ
jgi:hypothetical protein